MTKVELADRLAAIEADVAALKANVAIPPRSHPIHAIERIHGTFADDPAFREAARLGRQWRRADRPAAPARKAKRA